jgi:hypothetical protein
MQARTLAVGFLASALLAGPAQSFCGFYVAKADADLWNEASRVVLVRDDDRTIVTMVNDYQGDPTEFALVVPIPTFLERDQIHVGEMSSVDHLDAYTAPRLVEYHDPDPCQLVRYERMMGQAADASLPTSKLGRDPDTQVTVEATYTVGEYDIVILSAEESHGLETWLHGNGYRIPDGANEVLGSYIRQGLRFFVARVNLDEQASLGFTTLRPLQIAYESDRFMLPIRLGTVNARGPQDLILWTLTRTGRVETTNYRTVKIPSDVDLPEFVEEEFADVYRDLFARQVEKENRRAVFLEYAWDMAWCDPCAADPLSSDELRKLGVFWLDDASKRPGRIDPGPASNVFVTRLHVRYDAAHFPDDLFLQETGDRSNFQGRYVIRHPWTGSESCDAAQQYRAGLAERRAREARNLADLTGWDLQAIRDRMGGLTLPPERPWYRRVFGG